MPIINPLNIDNFSSGLLVHNKATATLASANWVDNSGVYTQTVFVQNMTSTATVWVSPQYDATTNYTEYYATDQIVPVSQTTDYITFRRYANSSSGDIQINIVWVEQGSTDSQTIVLNVDNWVNGQQVISIPGLSASSNCWVSPDDVVSNIENYCNAQIYCSDQINGQLTFTYAGTKPTENISVNVFWMDTVATSSGQGNVLILNAEYDFDNEVLRLPRTISDIYNYFKAGVPVKIYFAGNANNTEHYMLDVTYMYLSSSSVYSITALSMTSALNGYIGLRGFVETNLSASDTEIVDTNANLFNFGYIAYN